ncbi:MAG: peptidylprolyl isomerase, partial [Sphingosinicella sp.]
MRVFAMLIAFGLVAAPAAVAQTTDAAQPAAATAQPAGPPPPPPAAEPENVWHLDLTSGGRVSIQLRPDVAPAHVERIKALTRRGFYNGIVFHRVIEGFMAQSGDPTGTGAGGSDLADLVAEIRGLPHLRGAVAMARAQDLNSANSQFYIMFTPRLGMDPDYTVFGRVIAGMSYVDALERGEPPVVPTRIVRASIGADNVPALTAEELRAAAAQLASAPPPPVSTAAAGRIAAPPPPPPPGRPRA